MKTYDTHGLSIEIHDDVDSLLSVSGLRSRLELSDWENGEVNAVRKGVHPDSAVLELGACIGIVSCITNQILSNKKNHVVVEANPKLINQLRAIRDANNCEFKIENCVVGKCPPRSWETMTCLREFNVHKSHVMGSSLQVNREGSTDQTLVVQKSIEQLEFEHGLTFDTLLMDIEFGEYELFEDYLIPDHLYPKFKTIIIEFHLNKIDDPKCLERMENIRKTLNANGFHEDLSNYSSRYSTPVLSYARNFELK